MLAVVIVLWLSLALPQQLDLLFAFPPPIYVPTSDCNKLRASCLHTGSLHIDNEIAASIQRRN